MSRIKLELLWIAITLVVMLMILLPIWQSGEAYPFYFYNLCFIFIFFSCVRYIFLLKYSWLHKNKWAKAVLFFLCIPLFILCMEGLFLFRSYLEDHGMQNMFQHLPYKNQKFLGSYTRAEMFFFGVGSMMTLVILPIKLIISTWRDVNIKE